VNTALLLLSAALFYSTPISLSHNPTSSPTTTPPASFFAPAVLSPSFSLAARLSSPSSAIIERVAIAISIPSSQFSVLFCEFQLHPSRLWLHFTTLASDLQSSAHPSSSLHARRIPVENFGFILAPATSNSLRPILQVLLRPN
jgi:hypothetical protein